MARRSGHSDRLLPLVAAERALRGLILLGAGIYLLTHTGTNFGSTADRFARAIELDTHRPWVRHLIHRLGRLREHEVTLFGAGALAYGVLELVEGVGLFLRQRWAEWLTVVATALLVPFELYELVGKPTVLKAAGLAVNIAIVIYLIRVVRRRG
jgi:uncharacterized membrane protein (DUF2068 family)